MLELGEHWSGWERRVDVDPDLDGFVRRDDFHPIVDERNEHARLDILHQRGDCFQQRVDVFHQRVGVFE